MATYGYSAGYQGGGPQPVAPGFIEGYAQAGRSIGAGIQSIGSAIGGALQRYGEKKAENEFLTQRLESLAPYLQTVAQSGNIMDERSPESKLLGDIEKFSSMSIPQKKATLLNAEFYLDRLDKQKARELTDLQAQAARFNLQTAQDAEARRIREQGIISSAISYAMGQPTTRTEVQQVTEEVPMPPMPPVMPSGAAAAPAGPSQAEATAARYFMGQFGQAAQDLRRYGMGLGSQAAALNVSPTPQVSYPPVFPFPGRPSPTRVESPIEAAARVEANRRAQEQLTAESAAALQQADIMQRAQPLRTTMPPSAPAAPAAPMEAVSQPTVTVTRGKKVEVPVDYEQRSKDLTQFLIQQGAKPETIAMVPQLMSMIGQRKPTTVEQVGNLGSVVRFGDKEQFVPSKEANLDNILKVRGLTVDFPEFKGTATTEAEAVKFRDQYSNVLESRQTIAELLDIAKMGPAMQQTPEIRARANSLASSLRGIERINIIGPGTITPEDFKLLESVIPNPTAIFSLKKSNIQAFETMLQKATRAIESKAKAIGLEVVKPQQQSVAKPSGGFLRWNTVTQKFE